MTTLTITDSPTGLAIIFNESTIPLSPTHAERTLSDTLLCVRAGISTPIITNHLLTHQSTPSSKCGACLLTGRVLSAQGRRLTSEADRSISSRKHNSGTVQVRHLPAGLSGAQISALIHRRTLYATPPQSTVVASTKRRLEDLI
jgi:hypothetical protein